MYKLEGKLLEEYLQIVLDVQKRNVLLRELKTEINDDRSVLRSNSFIRERAKEAKESVLNRVMYAVLIFLVSLIALAETWGLFIGVVYFLIEFWKDGFNNFENCLAIILCSFTSIGWFLISIAAWYGILFLINQYRKELKNVNSMPDDYSENKTLSKEKVILLKPEIDALNELWEVWSEIEEYWNSNTYDVSTRQFITKSSDLYFELEKCAVMYEYINSGKCIKLEGQEGAFGLMKSDVKKKKICQKPYFELIKAPEEVKDSHPVLYEALVYINDRIKRIQKSNDEILNEHISRYGNHSSNEQTIRGLYEKTECYAFVQECRKKLQEYENWRIKLTGKPYTKKKKRLIDY